MSTYRLERLFKARSVALVGGSPRPNSLGRSVLDNLRHGGFCGRIDLINPKYSEISGLKAVPHIESLPEPPDVVVVTAPAPAVPDIIRSAGLKKAGVAVVISAGLGHGAGSLADRAREIAYETGLRIVGPNGLGALVPPIGLNASFAARSVPAGDLALVSQSGAVAAGLVEWSVQRSIGFSAILSIGDAFDVDFADLLDFLSADRGTRAILLYVEAVTNARKFLSAARAAARTKPVVVLKSGRHAQGAKAAATHTGALAGVDAVYDAAFRRAGLLRVLDFGELFTAAETVARLRPPMGSRLSILTNGGGIGVLAVDRLIDLGGSLAPIGSEALDALNRVLPPGWSRSNPVDIIGDADGARYAAAMDVLLEDKESDALLVLNVPTALASSLEAARTVAAAASRPRSYPRKPVFAGWIGESRDAAETFNEAGLPHYATEADAVAGFMHLARYREAQEALMVAPPSLPESFMPDIAAARKAIDRALQDGRKWLDALEIDILLRVYGIPAPGVVLVENPEAAAEAARGLFTRHGALAVKIASQDIIHKSDIGGVQLNLRTVDDVRTAAAAMIERARASRPGARIAGVTLHPMIIRRKARELIAGIVDDPVFGPVVLFGCGGTAVEAIDDKALALPPLDMNMARDLMRRTRIFKLLEGYRDVCAADLDGVASCLIRMAQMAADLPEIRDMDLNPLLADAEGVIVLDARVAVTPLDREADKGTAHPRLAIQPYPKEWERHVLAGTRQVFLRPIRPEDEDAIGALVGKVTDEDLRLRFFSPIKTLSHPFIARLTQLDYARSMAFVALDEADNEMLGVVHLHADSNLEAGEYSVLVRSDLKGQGLGWLLMQTMLEYARAKGLRRVEGQVLRKNTTMLRMCAELGFRITTPEGQFDICEVELELY